jgi:hypothetical protein
LFEHDLFRKSLPRFGIMRGEWLDFVVFTGLPGLWQLTLPPGAAGAALSIEAMCQHARQCLMRSNRGRLRRIPAAPSTRL